MRVTDAVLEGSWALLHHQLTQVKTFVLIQTKFKHSSQVR